MPTRSVMKCDEAHILRCIQVHVEFPVLPVFGSRPNDFGVLIKNKGGNKMDATRLCHILLLRPFK